VIEHAIVVYVVNAAWEIPVAAIGAAILVRAGALTPSGRHRVWLAAIVLAATLPALAGGGVTRDVTAWGRPAQATSPDATTATVPMTASRQSPRVTVPPRLELQPGPVRLVSLAFLTMIVIGAARLAGAAAAAAAIARRPRPSTLPPPVALALRDVSAAHRRAVPQVRTSKAIGAPVAFGALRPMILIPEGFAELGEDDQRAAVLHEFAHVLRRDYAVNLIVELASLPVCWHPLTHLIKARLRASREVACDAMASATEASPASYASRLLSLARALGPQEVASAALMTMIGKSDLEERLMQLLAQTPPPGHTRLRLLAAGAAAGAILAPALLFQVTPAFAAIATPATVAALAPVAPIDPIDPVDAPAPIAPRAPAAVVAPVAPIAPVAPVAVTRARARLAPFERLALADDPRDAAEASPTPREPAEAPIVDEAQIRQIVRQALEQSA
jgi:beta-lactamase regulating signal transducer with metallopeptidase domain